MKVWAEYDYYCNDFNITPVGARDKNDGTSICVAWWERLVGEKNVRRDGKRHQYEVTIRPVKKEKP